MVDQSFEQQLESMATRLRALEDEKAIIQVMYTYSHALDYDYPEQWDDLWTEDSVLYWGPMCIRGKELINEAFHIHPHAPRIWWKHYQMNPRVIVDGNQATAESYFTRFAKAEDDRPQVMSFGRYSDKLIRCADGRWRFLERNAAGEAWTIEEEQPIEPVARKRLEEKVRLSNEAHEAAMAS